MEENKKEIKKCEYHEIRELEYSLFFKTEEIDWCKLENEKCPFEGNENICPFMIGIFY